MTNTRFLSLTDMKKKLKIKKYLCVVCREEKYQFVGINDIPSVHKATQV